MPFERPTLQAIMDQISADLESRLPGVDPNLRRSFLNVLSRAFAGALHGHYGFLDYMANQVFPDTAEAEFLDRWANVWGIARKPAWPASGNVTFSGTDGVSISAGTVLKRGDDVVYETLMAADIVGGNATISVEAQEGGAIGNAVSGVSLNMIAPAAGVQTTVTVSDGGLVQGSDIESDASLLARLLTRIQQPPHGGADFDYKVWALNRAAHGLDVSRVWVFPQEAGLGTVTLRFMMDDTYADGIPQQADIDTLSAYMETVRPVSSAVITAAPTKVPLNFNISGLNPATQTVKDAIEAELRDLIRREAEPDGTLLLSHIREAISIAAGEYDHTLVTPNSEVTVQVSQITTFGTIEWS